MLGFIGNMLPDKKVERMGHQRGKRWNRTGGKIQRDEAPRNSGDRESGCQVVYPVVASLKFPQASYLTASLLELA